ncbi:hypothetical protein FSP39_021570 [Pinctada imbricata]|uniref:Apple domain-containing protein n=1 Tax=Pinctada imbricata TaxID=66713 RepID=A0AA88Y666_PINIB|nr:hypothetical protein FSP39_021570 [Pinctada imbricata]
MELQFLMLVTVIGVVTAKDFSHIWAKENANLNGVTVFDNVNVIRSMKTSRKGKCAYTCCNDISCMAFFFNKKLSQCILMDLVYAKRSLPMLKWVSLDWTYYIVYGDNVSSYREENLLDVSHLKGKDIRSIGWIQASFANEGFQEANLPKRALKEYLNIKDKLFVTYMDLFIGGRSTQEKKFPPGMFRVMSDTLRRRRKRQLPFIHKNSVLISRYALKGGMAAARKDLKKLKQVASEFRDDGSFIIGPYMVKLDETNSKKPTISIQLSGIKEEAGSIIRRYIYQQRRNKAMYRSGGRVKLPKKGQKQSKVKEIKKRLGQLQRKRFRLQKRLRQEKQKQRRNLKQRKHLSNLARRKAKLEARKRRKEERTAQRKLKQKIKRINQEKMKKSHKRHEDS